VRRTDDEPEAIRTRMRAYRGQTEPVIEWYRARENGAAGTRVISVDAVGGVEEVTERVLRELR
jgi:adenylate kinase